MYYNNVYEPETTEYMKRHIKPGGIVADVGANVGYYTLIMARMVGPKGLVYAFEPNDELRAILRRNVIANGYRDRVRILPYAVTDNIGTATFFENRGHGQNSLEPRKGTVAVKEVQTITLDWIFGPLPTVNLVKIDVEGTEVKVIRGLRKTMEKYPDMAIIFEFLPQHTGFSWLEIEQQLDAYALSALDWNLLATKKEE